MRASRSSGRRRARSGGPRRSTRCAAAPGRPRSAPSAPGSTGRRAPANGRCRRRRARCSRRCAAPRRRAAAGSCRAARGCACRSCRSARGRSRSPRAPAGALEELDRVGRRLAAGVGHHHAAGQVLEPRHPQAHAELARQPAGHADVVGVHVGDEHARQRPLVGRVGEQLAPDRDGFLGANAGVHDRPARRRRRAPRG